jgi:type II secretory pathway predicted ATPase ExeA
VALFIDEAHDLNGHTLIGLKRLMELAEDVGGRLSVILAGHPKLRNDIFTLDGIAGSQRDSIGCSEFAPTTRPSPRRS